jgi:exosortase
MESVKHARGRAVTFLLLSAVNVALFFIPLQSLFRFSLNDETLSYIPLVPFISGFLILQRRKEIFSDATGSALAGAILVSIGIVLFAVGSVRGPSWAAADRHSIMAVSAVACFTGVIGICFGSGALKTALFPLAFLIFMAPVPAAILDRVVGVLQYWSAEVSYAFLKLTGVPVFREGYVFHVPGLSVEVAKECSGIRSSLALLLVSLLAGHLYLKTGWRRTVLCAMVVPVTILENGIRIVAVTLLGAYVDRAFLTGILHQSGGMPFFLAALALLAALLWSLRRSEKAKQGSDW